MNIYIDICVHIQQDHTPLNGERAAVLPPHSTTRVRTNDLELFSKNEFHLLVRRKNRVSGVNYLKHHTECRVGEIQRQCTT